MVYTNKSLVVKLRSDLMPFKFSSIWLEVGLVRQKKFFVSQIYREWQLVNPNLANRSSSVDHQPLVGMMARISRSLGREKALNSGLEVHVVGDVSLNHCNWTIQNLPPSSKTVKLPSSSKTFKLLQNLPPSS